VVYSMMFSVAQTGQYWMAGWIMSGQLERMWKESVVTYFEALFRNFFGETEENHNRTRRCRGPKSEALQPELTSWE
jgi:hypothetical protein